MRAYLADTTLSALIASAVRSVRIASGWSQRELARRLGASLGAIQRLEGAQPHVDARLATEALRLLGIRLTLDQDPIGLAARREQRDATHA